jgi:hypothetical protein
MSASESTLIINKNRSTFSVGGLWETDAPKGTCSEPPSPFPEVDKIS